MTIRECIMTSLQGEEELNGERTYCWEYFLINYSVLLIGLTKSYLRNDLPIITSTEFKTKPKIDDSYVMSYMHVFRGIDIMRHTLLFYQTRDFWNWFLEEDAEDYIDEESLSSWYDIETLTKAWDRYVKIRKT